MPWQVPQETFLDIATVVVGVGGPLNGLTMGLFQNDIVPTPSTPLASLTPADYDGYAEEANAWLAPTISDAGVIEVHGIVGEFRPTGSVTPNSIYGWYLKNAGGDLVASDRFAGAPLAMGSALNNILPTLIYRPGITGTIEVIT